MPKPRQKRPAAPLALAILLGVALLTGCANSGSPEDGGAEDRDQDESAPPIGTDCLTGTWQMRNETFEATVAQMMQDNPSLPAEMQGEAAVEFSGASFMRFDGAGLYTAWLEDFTITMTVSGNRVRHVQNSGDAASYEANDEYLWVTDFIEVYFDAEMVIDGMGSVELDSSDQARVSAFGYTADVPGVDRELVDGAARYECAPDSLVMHADGGLAAGFTRVASDARQPGA